MRLARRSLRTTSERADRGHADACFNLAEQASEEAGPTHLVLIRSGRVGRPQRRRSQILRCETAAVASGARARREARRSAVLDGAMLKPEAVGLPTAFRHAEAQLEAAIIL